MREQPEPLRPKDIIAALRRADIDPAGARYHIQEEQDDFGIYTNVVTQDGEHFRIFHDNEDVDPVEFWDSYIDGPGWRSLPVCDLCGDPEYRDNLCRSCWVEIHD